ncbi:MAG: hypothetical protein L0K86_22710, partial [Actinomycetia bacterium]|nr:hypothetical protein [Actinomycetes bacterium]
MHMSLFAHYPAKPADILGHGDVMLSGSRGISNVFGLFAGRTSVAAGGADGELEAPVLGLRQPVEADTVQLASAGTVAGGALGLFAGAVADYNDGVDDLNRIYERAKAANFYAEPVADDETGAAGEKLSDDERVGLFDRRVSSAKSALEHLLGIREAGLMRDLDGSADNIASLLGQATDPKFTVPLVLTSLFGFGGGGDDEEDEEDDGGLFNDIGSAVSGGWDVVSGAGEEVWDRGSTLAVYGWDTARRRVTNPGQTMWDYLTGTALVEDVSAAEGILVEDGELVRDGEYCGDDAACLTGVSVPGGADAITTGHTVRFSDEDAPQDDLVAHEMQHVLDIEDVGTAGFYGSYLTEYLARRAAGQSHNEAYENITWEMRAYDVQDDHPDRKPRGILSDLYDKLFG